MQKQLLDRSASDSLCIIIKEQLQNARRCLGQIKSDERSEALHSFRVSLRRLRIWVKPLLGKDKKRIQHLVQITNQARDLEVRISLFRQHLSASQLTSKRVLKLQVNWQEEIEENYEYIMSEMSKNFKKINPTVEELLSNLRDGKSSPIAQSSFEEWITPILAEQARRADAALREIHSASDEEECHQARLLVKTLRYLLEPLSAELAQSGKILYELRRVQDLLGGLRDAQMLSHDLDKVIRKSKKGEGLSAIEEANNRNKNEIAYLYAELQNKILISPGPQFAKKVRRAVTCQAMEKT